MCDIMHLLQFNHAPVRCLPMDPEIPSLFFEKRRMKIEGGCGGKDEGMGIVGTLVHLRESAGIR